MIMLHWKFANFIFKTRCYNYLFSLPSPLVPSCVFPDSSRMQWWGRRRGHPYSFNIFRRRSLKLIGSRPIPLLILQKPSASIVPPICIRGKAHIKSVNTGLSWHRRPVTFDLFRLGPLLGRRPPWVLGLHFHVMILPTELGSLLLQVKSLKRWR